jgi:predicted phosphodiesterase
MKPLLLMRAAVALSCGWGLTGPGGAAEPPGPTGFSFVVTCDMRQYVGPAPAGQRYFDGACEAIRQLGGGAFMITPGDCDPLPPVRATLDRILGSNYVWYPVAGNHEAETAVDMAWLRAWASNGIPRLARAGPPGAAATMYSFDFGDSHFAALNNYFSRGSDAGITKGDISDAALDWLESDLAATSKSNLWVIGHAPIESQPDMDNGRVRHKGEDLAIHPERCERMVRLLRQYRVRAYLCGHTHNTSVTRVRGVWQVDAGHARGGGDTGAASSFLVIQVAGPQCRVDVYRSDLQGLDYQLRHTVELD